jgi:hypothetical protein
MRICKPTEAVMVFGQGSPSMGWSGGGFESALSAATQPSTTPTAPTTTNSTFTVSPNVTGPTYNGQPVSPVYGTTYGIQVSAPTFGITSNAPAEVSYYDNGVMCIDPGAVNNGQSSGMNQTDTGLAGNANFGGIDTSNMG